MAKSENVVREDGQTVEVEFPGQALQDQATVKAAEEADGVNRGGSRSTDAGFDKALEEVRQVREDNERRARLHNRTVIEREIAATDKNGKDKFIEVCTADQRVFINTHGEAILDREGVIQLQQAAVAASQAVS